MLRYPIFCNFSGGGGWSGPPAPFWIRTWLIWVISLWIHNSMVNAFKLSHFLSAYEKARPVLSPCDCWNGGVCFSPKNGSKICLCPQGNASLHINTNFVLKLIIFSYPSVLINKKYIIELHTLILRPHNVAV